MSEPVAVSAAEQPSVADFARIFRRIQAEIHKVIIGHEQAVEELLSALFAGGHSVMVLAIAALLGYLGSRFSAQSALVETIGDRVERQGGGGGHAERSTASEFHRPSSASPVEVGGRLRRPPTSPRSFGMLSRPTFWGPMLLFRIDGAH